MTLKEMGERLQQLEAEMAELRRRIANSSKAPGDRWWIEDAGRFADDPEFQEMIRLGREYRESLRPKPQTKPRAKATR